VTPTVRRRSRRGRPGGCRGRWSRSWVRGVPGASAATREHVLQVAEELGTGPIRGPGCCRTAFACSRDAHPQPSVPRRPGRRYLRRPEHSATRWCSAPVTAQRDPRRAIDTLLDYRCAAAILSGRSCVSLVVGVGRAAAGRRARAAGRSRAVDVIRIEDAAGVRLAVDHLPSWVTARSSTWTAPSGAGAADRRNGYRTAMRRVA